MFKFQMDFSKRINNVAWWVSLIGAIGFILSYFGVDITNYIGQDWKGLIGAIFSLLTILGITADTSTKGFSDQVVANASVQAVNSATDNNVATKTEATTTSINNTVTENSQATGNLKASSKIQVDVPVEE